MGPIEEKVLPFPIKFPAQSLTASPLIGVDEYLDGVPWPQHLANPHQTKTVHLPLLMSL